MAAISAAWTKQTDGTYKMDVSGSGGDGSGVTLVATYSKETNAAVGAAQQPIYKVVLS